MTTKVLISNYQKSLRDVGIWTAEDIAIIWDFYVTKSVAASASQKRSAADYGLREIPFDSLLDHSHVSAKRREILMANSIDGVLSEYGFKCRGKDSNKNAIELEIEIDELRLLCIQPYSIADRKGPEPKAGKGVTLLTHIRNSLAHGCTYFFDNGNVLFEDKASGAKGKTTAMILLPQTALTDWIKAIDIEAKYYFPGVDRGPFRSLVKAANKPAAESAK